MTYLIKGTLLTFILTIALGVQTSYADCMRISSVSCYAKDYTDEDAMIRIGGLIKHKKTNMDTINLFCPITFHGVRYQKIETFSLYLKDKLVHPLDALWGEGNDKNNIIAKIRNVDGYGDINTIMNLYSANGNREKMGTQDWGEQGYYRVTDFISTKTMDITETGDGSRYGTGGFYFLDVSIARSTLSDTPVFSGVSICGETTR